MKNIITVAIIMLGLLTVGCADRSSVELIETDEGLYKLDQRSGELALVTGTIATRVDLLKPRTIELAEQPFGLEIEGSVRTYGESVAYSFKVTLPSKSKLKELASYDTFKSRISDIKFRLNLQDGEFLIGDIKLESGLPPISVVDEFDRPVGLHYRGTKAFPPSALIKVDQLNFTWVGGLGEVLTDLMPVVEVSPSELE